ncbi:MAG: hypothetical protein JHC33_13705 [Ignisphaera sp.]|nr:hypothetical protein [Ignisphaera sp.]
MAVRVRLRILREDRVVEVITLVNSGYETASPQLMIPVSLAKVLGLWPPSSDARERVLED